MIYVLLAGGYLTIGTADEIEGQRRWTANAFRDGRKVRNPPTLHKPEVLAMIEGDEATAEEIRRLIASRCAGGYTGRIADECVLQQYPAHDCFVRTLKTIAVDAEWSGEDARKLGIKAPTKRDHRPPAERGSSKPILGERLARRRVRTTGLGRRWDGPTDPESCPNCGGSVAGDLYCLVCDTAGFDVEDERATVHVE